MKQEERKMKGRDWKKRRITRRQIGGDGGDTVWEKSDFSFGTVNNSPCLSWKAFTAPFVCRDI